ncbi:MAG: hypothetical protein RLZZ505_2283 [Verrucomicrobiota bacterium]|jgi:hypothetical protein
MPDPSNKAEGDPDEDAEQIVARIWGILHSAADSGQDRKAKVVDALCQIATEACNALAATSLYAEVQKRELAMKSTRWPLLVDAANRDSALRWFSDVMEYLELGAACGFDVTRKTTAQKSPQRLRFAEALFTIVNGERRRQLWGNQSDDVRCQYAEYGKARGMTAESAFNECKKINAEAAETARFETGSASIDSSISLEYRWKTLNALIPKLTKDISTVNQWVECSIRYLQYRAGDRELHRLVGFIPEDLVRNARGGRAKTDSGIDGRLISDLRAKLAEEFQKMAK